MANFFLKIDKPFYFAGEVVTGHLLVNVTQPLAATGISLKFSGYQCVKWNTSTEIVRPRPIEGQPPPPDPIAQIPPHLIMNTDNFQVSDVTSEDMVSFHERRPQYIRTSAGKVFKMRYHETRNLFGRVKTMIYECNGLAPGQYSFPITFKTFEGWPASFQYYTPRKKGRICYHLVAMVEPENPMWEMKCGAQVILRETKVISTPTKSCNAEVTSCCCIGKGNSAINVHFEKDGYIPGEMVRVIVEIDNSMCQADIQGLNISINNTVGLRSSDGSTADSFPIFSKVLPGIRAGEKLVGSAAITEQFQLLSDRRQIKPTCNGKLLSSVYDLSLGLSHDVACQCCSGSPGVSLRVMIFPSPLQFQMPSTFTSSSWQPKMMPNVNLVINNAFQNFKIGQMMGSAVGGMNGNYPPLPPVLPPMGGGGGGFNGNNNNGGFNNKRNNNNNNNNMMAEMINQGFNNNNNGGNNQGFGNNNNNNQGFNSNNNSFNGFNNNNNNNNNNSFNNGNQGFNNNNNFDVAPGYNNNFSNNNNQNWDNQGNQGRLRVGEGNHEI